MTKLLFVTVLAVFMLGCASNEHRNSHLFDNHSQLFLDASFSDFDATLIEKPQEVFDLSEGAKRYVDKNIRIINNPSKRIELLANAMFDKAEVNLDYSSNANTIAADTFLSRKANCLSMTILTYSMAKYAGLDAEFQEVKIPEFWIRSEQRSILNRHVNLRLKAPEKSVDDLVPVELGFGSSARTVDFNINQRNKNFSSHRINKETVLAMFYNNKGAEALIESKYDKAYWYFRTALQHSPEFVPAWGNLGITYRLTKHDPWVELVYRHALNIDPKNLNVLENLAILKDLENKPEQAQYLQNKIQGFRVSNPFYYYMLGEEKYDEGDFHAAISYFNKAVRLDRNIHDFYFGLAKAWFRLGDIEKSHGYLRRAKIKSMSPDLEHKYQNKLELLSRLSN